MSFFASIAATIIVVGALIATIGPANIWQRLYGDPDLGPFDLAILERSLKPHDALLCTPGSCNPSIKVDGDLPVFDEKPIALLERLAKHIESHEGTRQSVNNDAASGSIRYLTRTAWLKFPDTTQFWAVPMADGKTGLVAYSRAQVGYSDLGANLKRLKDWTNFLVN
ncbi:MAG: DUF1499 domain-containing protein [Pseudomonadota bacterium]